HQKAATATARGFFRDEIVPVSVVSAFRRTGGDSVVVDRDEAVRPETTVESLSALKPAFKQDGSVTAGNAPGVNDGASALVLMSSERAHALGIAPLARIAGQAASGIAP